MTTPTRSILAACALSLALLPTQTATAQQANGGGRSLQLLPIPQIITPQHVPDGIPLRSLLGRPYQNEELAPPLDASREEPGMVSADGLMEVAYRTHEEAFDNGDATILVQGGTLAITGPTEVVDSVARTIQQVTGALLRPMELEVRLYPWSGALPPTVLSAEEVDQRFGGRDYHWHGVARSVPGRVCTIGELREVPYVRETEAEVANDSKIYTPIVSHLLEGIEVALQPHATLQPDHIALFGEMAFGRQRGPINSRRTGVKDMLSLDAPDLFTTTASFGGVVPPGGALALSATGDASLTESFVVLVKARFTTAPPNPINDVEALPISALTTTALRTPGETISYGPRTLARNEEWFEFDTEPSTFDYDTLMELLAMANPAIREAWENDVLRMDQFAGHLLVQGPAGIRNQARTTLAGIEARVLAGCSVQLTAREMGADDVTFYQAALPAFAGHNIHLNQGRETTALTTYHVEIAEKSSAAVPEVENVFRGMRAGLVPHLGPQGVGFLGAIDLYANSLPVRRASEGSQIGDLYLSDRRYTRFTWRDSTAGPGPHNLGEGPRIGINGVDRRTTMQVEIIPPGTVIPTADPVAEAPAIRCHRLDDSHREPLGI